MLAATTAAQALAPALQQVAEQTDLTQAVAFQDWYGSAVQNQAFAAAPEAPVAELANGSVAAESGPIVVSGTLPGWLTYESAEAGMRGYHKLNSMAAGLLSFEPCQTISCTVWQHVATCSSGVSLHGRESSALLTSLTCYKLSSDQLLSAVAQAANAHSAVLAT